MFHLGKLGKPKISICRTWSGDGSLTKVLWTQLKNSINIYLYKKSELLKNVQKKIKRSKVKWIGNFDKIRKGLVIFLVMNFSMQYR